MKTLTKIAKALKEQSSQEQRGSRRAGAVACQIGMLCLLIHTTESPAAEPERGVLKIHIRQADSGQATPARLELRDGIAGRFVGAWRSLQGVEAQFYVAPGALRIGGDCVDHPEPVPTRTLDLTLASLAPSINNWYTRTLEFYSPGESSIELPAGMYQLTAYKGCEYRVATHRAVVEAGQTTELFVDLSRWVNMPAEGWYGSDGHLHIARPIAELNPYISRWMQAEDIHVANLLQWGHSQHFHNAVQYAHGEDGVYQEGNYLLVAGQENPRSNILGHTVILGARSPVHVPELYLVYRLAFEEAHRQGGLSGYAHFAHRNNAPRGIAIDLPHDVVDFIEVLQFGEAGYSIWYDVLNLGYRLTPTAGTDYPCSRIVPGSERFYTRVEGPLTYKKWLESVAEGRTFVTNGPILHFKVDGKNMGDEVRLDAPREVDIDGSVRFDNSRDQVTTLEVIENGTVIRTFAATPGASQIRGRFRHPVTASGWLALRASGRKVAEFGFTGEGRGASAAHTAAIYVTVKGTPALRDSAIAKAVAARWLERLKALESTLADGAVDQLLSERAALDAVPKDVLLKNRPALLESIRTASRRFEAQAR